MRKLLSLRLIILLAIAIGILSWLYSKSTAVEPEKHFAFVSGMRSIKQLDANLNQDVLRARYNLLVHYDPFVSTLNQLHALSNSFTREPYTGYLQDLDPALQQQTLLLKSAIDDKAMEIEHFKSRNAVLKNSLRYFPTLTTQLLKQAKQSQQSQLFEAVNQVEQAILILNLTGGTELEQTVHAELKQLHLLLPRLSDSLAVEIRTLISHTETILTTKREVDALANGILSAPLQNTVNGLSQTYEEANGRAMRHSGNYRALLYIFSVLLLGYVFYAVVRVKLGAFALEYQATHDLLTGLPNRTLLYRTLDDLFSNNQNSPVALLILDLDRFKEINDTLGHQAGDMALRQVAACVQSVVKEQGLVTRLGGDEFAVILPNIADGQQLLQYASRILTALRQPMKIMEIMIEVGCSIGISRYPEHGNSTSQLIRCADVAMYLAKGNGAGCALYDANLDQHSPRRLSIMTGLRQAIEQDQLLLHYQPKLRLETGAVSGFEALVRWQHPEHGMIPPDQFIPLAEMSDLIGPLTLWVVDHAMAQIKQWRSQGFEGSVAVNFSARNFLDDYLPQKITELLNKHDLPPSCFELEITESAMMADPTRSLQIMRRIKELGFHLSIDDYGTGHSSLAYLQQLPIHSLKIDLSFVRSMLASKENGVIVQSTIQLAHNLRLNVIAEGVEDQDTLAKLQLLECDEVQGYFISRPMPAEQASAWLEQKRCISASQASAAIG